MSAVANDLTSMRDKDICFDFLVEYEIMFCENYRPTYRHKRQCIETVSQ